MLKNYPRFRVKIELLILVLIGRIWEGISEYFVILSGYLFQKEQFVDDNRTIRHLLDCFVALRLARTISIFVVIAMSAARKQSRVEPDYFVILSAAEGSLLVLSGDPSTALRMTIDILTTEKYKIDLSNQKDWNDDSPDIFMGSAQNQHTLNMSL